MTLNDLEAARLELEFFDDPDFNFEDNEDDIIDLGVELDNTDEEGELLWDNYYSADVETYEKSFGVEGDEVEFEDNEVLCHEILKHAEKLARIVLEDNDCLPAYNVMVSINVWGTGEQYAIDKPISIIE